MFLFPGLISFGFTREPEFRKWVFLSLVAILKDSSGNSIPNDVTPMKKETPFTTSDPRWWRIEVERAWARAQGPRQILGSKKITPNLKATFLEKLYVSSSLVIAVWEKLRLVSGLGTLFTDSGSSRLGSKLGLSPGSKNGLVPPPDGGMRVETRWGKKRLSWRQKLGSKNFFDVTSSNSLFVAAFGIGFRNGPQSEYLG